MSATAYFGDETLKAKYVARMKGHREADELVQGYYWIDGKGGYALTGPAERVRLLKIAETVYQQLPSEAGGGS